MRICATWSVLAAMLLSGCEAVTGFENRYGPDPAMPSAIVKASVDNQAAIMHKLKEVADCGDDVGSECYYQVAVAGFNFVDEQCDAYLRELFALDKQRDRIKNVISSADKMTNAVLAVSPASKVTMAIVAQAFGLGSSYVDALADSYLFKTDAGIVFSLVSTLQAQYRDNIYKKRSEFIVSLPDSYGAIRGYLRLCMPPLIESKITSTLAGAKALPPESNPGPGSIQNIQLGN